MIKYTIIIPHYNSPDSLDRLLTSVGTHDDVQIIVVDDKSNKDSSKYAECKKKFKNVCSFFDNTTANKGAGVCRNIGLDKASGKWLLFADADDYFLENWYSHICSYYDSSADIVYFPPTSETDGKTGSRHRKYLKLVEEHQESRPDSDIHLRIQFFPPWSKLIRRSLVIENNIRFDETLFSNDVMFSTKAGYYADNIESSKNVIYCVVDKVGTLTKNKSFDAFYIRNTVICRVYDFLRSNLSKEQFKDAYIRNTPVVNIYNAFKEGYGIKDIRKIITLYHSYGIPIFSGSVFKKAVSFLKK